LASAEFALVFAVWDEEVEGGGKGIFVLDILKESRKLTEINQYIMRKYEQQREATFLFVVR